MAEQALAYAITTKARVKDRLGIDSSETSHDTMLDRIVNSVTDFVETELQRRLLETTYTNEVYSVDDPDRHFIVLRQAPVSTLSSFQYRAGTKSSPSWTDFLSNNYFLMEDGESGIIQVFGSLPQGPNTIRATYTAGYKIDFDNAGDNSNHTLPADITDLAERLITTWWRRKNAEGKESDSFEGGTVTWRANLTGEDKTTLQRHRRPRVVL